MAKQAIFDKKNILITGGAGFIGSFLCDELIRENKVICVDNFISGDEKNIDHLLSNSDFAFIKHDISKPIDLELRPELEKFRIKFQGVQEIYNLACPTSPRNFMEKRIDTVLANSLGVKNSLDLAVKYKAKYMHFSSAVVYGPRRPDMERFNEYYMGYLDPNSPRSSYDEGKRFAETLVTNYREVYDIDAKIARVFRTYGPRMKLHEGHMLPDFISNALDNKDLVIYGDDNFSSALLFITDLISAVKKFMASGETGPMNFGGEHAYKIIDVARIVIEKSGSHSKIVYKDPLLFMSPLGIPDISLAKERIGWFPIVLVEDGIQEAIDFLKANKPLVPIDSDLL